jgi:N-acyl amino acid synthase FeeM
MSRAEIATTRIESPTERAAAMDVIAAVYLAEKGWIADAEAEIPAAVAAPGRSSWFLARVDGVAAGVIRLTYDPPLVAPPELQFRFERDIDVARLAAECRVVDVGRFMILPRYRHQAAVALRLMRAAVEEVLARGYTHLVTDVFEGDPHSPLDFHTRVLGFERIATHRYGELACERLRVVLMLDLAKGYRRLAGARNRVFRELTRGLGERLEALAQRPALPVTG